MKTRLAATGRLTVWLEPRDAWIGAFFGPDATYVCLVPFIVVRWARRTR